MLVGTKTVESKYLNNQYYHNNYKDVGHKMKQHESIEKKLFTVLTFLSKKSRMQ